MKASYHTQSLVHRLPDVDGFSLQIRAETELSQGATHELTTHTPLPHVHFVTYKSSSAQVKVQRPCGLHATTLMVLLNPVSSQLASRLSDPTDKALKLVWGKLRRIWPESIVWLCVVLAEKQQLPPTPVYQCSHYANKEAGPRGLFAPVWNWLPGMFSG